MQEQRQFRNAIHSTLVGTLKGINTITSHIQPTNKQSNKRQNQQTSILNKIKHLNLAPTNNKQSINQENKQTKK
jgi:hypothetical protein